MFFSVIVTIFNGESFLTQCLDSILCNPSGNYELIIIDDGSTDGTGTICDAYSSRYKHVKYLHTSNHGIGNARQTGLQNASGEYIIFVDGDDEWNESFCLQKMEEEIKTSCADLYVFGYVLRRIRQGGYNDTLFEIKASLFENWRDNQAQFLSYFPDGMMFLCWNKIYRRQCIVANDIKSVQQQMEDFRFVLEFLKGARKVVFLSIVPYIHIKRGEQCITSKVHSGVTEGYNNCHYLFLSLFDKEYADEIHRIMAAAYVGTINHHLGFIDSHKEKEIAKDVLREVYNNELAKQSFLHYRPNSLSERVSFFLMRNGRFDVLRRYRKLVRAIKGLVY